MSGETKFSVMCSLFNWMQKSKSSSKKRSKFRKFIDNFCKPTDYFNAIRLILPSLDRERGSYGLKESVLATCLIDALGMSRESQDALRLINWRKGGAKTGANAGNFSQVAAEVLQLRQGITSGGLTINELNNLLDRLASSENRAEKTSVLSELIRKTNAQEMKWIVMIILKDLKLGTSEKSIFHEFHPDAEDLFNVTCDLKLVCEKLRDRSQRHKRQDIEVGKPVRPQLALRVSNAASAWKKLHGKEVVVECKFDGDRIQIHKNGEDIHFFSRNFLDHPEYGHAMSKIIKKYVLVDRCILDGEMLVWDTSMNRFAEFGSNQEIAKAAKEGLDSDRQLCYVAFDILYVGDTSVIHQSLKERHELLRKVVKPIKGHLEILVPYSSLNVHRPSGEPCWSRICYGVDDVESFFKETIDNRDEGIVLKDLASKWEPSDRSVKWLKLKPEYIRAGSDLDVLIIGGYYGSGRRGGEVAQFLVGLAERPTTTTYPRRFVSFCRVGTGLSDDELDAVVTKLKPYFRKYEYPKKAAPSFYQVTNNSKERPDVWIDSPEKSIILSVNSDIRTIRSEVFAAPYSLRFPRIDRVRYDKPWHECLDVQSFIDLVHSSNGTTQREGNHVGALDDKPKRAKVSRKGEKNSVTVVPSYFVQTDVSHIKGDTLIFSNMMFYFVNLPPTHSLDSLHRLVAENGGTSSMNLNNTLTHCIAAESKGIKFNAAKLRGDVIRYSWLFDCCSQKKLLPLKSKYFLHLSEQSKKMLEEEIDEFSDSYFLNLDIVDLKQLLHSIDRSEESKSVDYYKKKYCPRDKWSYFSGCCIYFHLSIQRSLELKALLELAQRRMKLEVSMGGGKVSSSLSQATHLVILPIRGFNVDIDAAASGFSPEELHLICNNMMHVVGPQWLEDCIENNQRLTEDTYSIKLKGLEDSAIREWPMDKFVTKRPRNSADSCGSSTPTLRPNVSLNSNSSFEFDPNDILSDPGLRKRIEEFPVSIRDRIRREYISKGPCQPFRHIFPKTQCGQKMRSFREEWFNMFDWLEYSIVKDAAYCFSCYLFKPTNVSRFGDEVFTGSGFKNWKRALEKFKDHVGGINSVHHDARTLFDAFKNQRQSVSHALASQSREIEVDYHTRLTATLDVTTLLLRQGLSFRGHDESSTSMNKGNFLEFLEWYSKRNNNIFKVVSQNAPGNNHMTSPLIQKQMANACAVETTLAILNDIGDNLFTILVDESHDISVKEQMAVVLRYVNKCGEVIERFLAVVHVTDTSSKCLKDAIDALFAKQGLSLSRLRGQGYDGASNMRGQFHGLKSLILKENPSAWYVHCFAHQLQLVIVAVAKTNRVVSDFFNLITLIVNMSGSSCKRADHLRQSEHDRIIERLETGEITSGRGQNQETGLARPCDTRWGSHYITLLRLNSMWPSVIKVLENVFDDGSNSDTRGMSKTLLIRMETYDFVFIFHLMKHILGYTNELSNLLQQRDQNIVQAMHLIENVKEQLQDFRDRGWEMFLNEVGSFCVANDIAVVNMEDIIKSRT